MPYKPKHPCGYPNCPELTDEAYCERHKPKVNRDYNRYGRDEDSKSFYNSAAERRINASRNQKFFINGRKSIKTGKKTAEMRFLHIKTRF
jgi:hypothetical protein